MSTVTSKRRVLANALGSWSVFAAGVVAAFVVTPALVHSLGDRRYGVWSLVESVLKYLTLFDLGLTVSMVHYVAKFQAAGDAEARNRVFSTSFVFFGAIGLGVLGIVAGLGLVGPRLFHIAPELAHEARWMFLLLGINIGISLPMGLFTSVLQGLSSHTTVAAIRLVVLVVRSVLSLAVVHWGGGLIALGAVITAIGLAESLGMAAAAWYRLPDLRLSTALVDRATYRTMRGYSLGAFLSALATQVSYQTDAIVIGLILGARFITYFTIANRLIVYARSSLLSITGVLSSAISDLGARGDTGRIRRALIDGTRYVLWCILPIQVGLVAFGKPFTAMWMGPRLAELSYPTMLILSSTLALSTSQSISVRIFYGMGHLGWFSRAMLAEAAANLVLSVALARPFGIAGVALGTAVPHLLLNLAIIRHVCRLMDVPVVEYLRRAFLPPLLLACVPAIGWLATTSLLPPRDWATLVATGSVGMGVHLGAAALIELGPGAVLRRLGAWADRLRARADRVPTPAEAP